MAKFRDEFGATFTGVLSRVRRGLVFTLCSAVATLTKILPFTKGEIYGKEPRK